MPIHVMTRMLVPLVLLAIPAWTAAGRRTAISGADLTIDGRPVIPHGMVHAGAEHFPKLKEMGIDSVHVDLAFRDFDPARSEEENRAAIAPFIAVADAAHRHDMTVLWLFSFHYTPAWLYERYPDVRMKAHDGSDAGGGWMNMCLNHEGFRADAAAWLTFVGKVLGPHPATLAYCLWNEPHLTSAVDYNRHTIRAYRAWLAGRHETIEGLNEAWGSAHASFDDVAPPPPRAATRWHEIYDRMVSAQDGRVVPGAVEADGDPAPWMDWMRFRQENFAAFFKWEADVVRAADPGAVITSKIVPFDLYTSHAYGSGVNTELWSRSFLDVLGMDLYSHLDEDFLARWKCDYFQSLAGGKPIWHTEFNFSFVKERGLATPEQWRTAFYYQLARGVNGLWNFMWSDDIEYTVHYKDYRFAPVTHEIARLSTSARRLAPLLRGMAPAPARVAVLHSTTTGLAVAGDYAPTADQTTIVELLYRSHTPFRFVTEQMVRDGELAKFRVLVAVGAVALPDDVLEAIRRFTVVNGGHVLANARFAELDAYGRHRADHPPAWLGARATGLHRQPREKRGTLRLARQARSVEDEPVAVEVALETYGARPIVLDDGTVLGAGDLYGDEDTQMAWSSGGRHELYWEDLEVLEGARVTGRFEDGAAAIVRTPQTVYIARDTCWVDERFAAWFRRFLAGSGVANRNACTLAGTGDPAPSVDLRMREGGDRRLLFVINSAPTLHYDGAPIDVEVAFEAWGAVTDALTGAPVASRWRDFRRIVPLRLAAGDVRLLQGRPYPGGWQHEKAQFDELQAHWTPRETSYVTWRRSPQELWVYDNRTELGVGMHGVSQDHFDLVTPLGIRLVRHTLYWYQLEKTEQPGVYDEQGLGAWDDTVARAKASGIELLVVVHGNVPGTGWQSRHESYERLARFMAFAARRWPSVRYWELWNEMDVGFTDLFGAGRKGYAMFERGRCYAQMLEQVYPAIKRGNPGAWVLTGGMTSTDEFIRGIYEEGGRAYFDFMNIHTYGVPVNWAMMRRAYIARTIMRRYGDFDRPLWNTEFGIDAGNLWAAWSQKTGAQFDAGHLGQWKTCIEEAGRHGLYWKILPYQFAAGNERGIDLAQLSLPEGHEIDDYGFGLLRRDGRTPRPTYDWLLEAQVNRPIRDQPRIVTDVELAWDGTWQPADRPYDVADGRIIIRNVTVDALEPTVIRLEAGPQAAGTP